MQALNGEGNDSRTHWQRPDAPLGTLIFREGLLSAEQLEESLGEAVKTGKRLGQVLVDKGLLQESQVARIIAKQKGLGFVNLAELRIDPETARLLPHETAWLHHALPIAVEDDLLVVAVEDPTDEEALDTVKAALGREARFVVATRSEILRILDELSSQKAPQPVPPGLLEGPSLNGNDLLEQSPSDPEPDARPAPVTVELSPLRIAAPEPELEHAATPGSDPAAFEAPEPEPAVEAPEPEPAAVEPPEPQPAAVEASEPAPEPVPVAETPAWPEVARDEPALTPEPVAIAPTTVPEPPPPASEPVPVAEPPSWPEVARDEPALAPEPVAIAPITVPEPPAPVPEPVQPAAAEPEPMEPAAVEPAPPAETPAPSAQPPVAAQIAPDPFAAPAIDVVQPATPDPVPQLRPPAPPEPAPPAVTESATPAQPVAEPAASGGEGHEVVVRLTDGEMVSAGRFPSPGVAKDAAKILTRQIASSPAGEWPEIGGRFVRPDLIVSVDVV